MGLNIIIYKIVQIEMIDDWNDKLVPYYRVERQNWFDSARQSGDKGFVLENEFISCDDKDEEGMCYVRPKDFNKSREWVKSNVIKGSQERILTALDKMQNDETLYFLWSW